MYPRHSGPTSLWLVLLLQACSSQHPIINRDLPAFLTTSGLTREQLVSRLGAPNTSFEHERILTYRLRHRRDGYQVIASNESWLKIDQSLVLVFDDDGRLVKHSMVAIRQ
jgi:hypothetical protein